MKEIHIKLTTDSIDKALKEIEEYRKSIDAKMRLAMQRLSEYGLQQLNVNWSTCVYDGIDIHQFSVEDTEKGFNLCCFGNAVAFIEFGAGVHYNPGGVRNYEGNIPDGIVGIGEYGQGRGKQQGWFFKNSAGKSEFTFGNPPEAPLYTTGQEMKQAVLDIFREVFANE